MNAKTKKILTGAGALALTAAISITGTVAYLTHITEQRANNFTFAVEGLDAMLTEPEWDGVVSYEYKDGKIVPVFGYTDADKDPTTPDVPVYGYKDGNKEDPITEYNPESPDLKDKTVAELRPTKDTPYGDTAAQKMIPGRIANKNPIITNTGEMDEWVAAKITFVYAEGTTKAGQPLTDTDMAKVTAAIDIDYDADKGTDNKWVRSEGTSSNGSQTFYYNELLAVSGKTASIFSTVTVKNTATTEAIKALEDIGGFAIWIEGYAVQGTEYKDGTEWTTSGTAVFENTPTDTDPAPVAQPGIIGSNGETASVKGNKTA